MDLVMRMIKTSLISSAMLSAILTAQHPHRMFLLKSKVLKTATCLKQGDWHMAVVEPIRRLAASC